MSSNPNLNRGKKRKRDEHDKGNEVIEPPQKKTKTSRQYEKYYKPYVKDQPRSKSRSKSRSTKSKDIKNKHQSRSCSPVKIQLKELLRSPPTASKEEALPKKIRSSASSVKTIIPGLSIQIENFKKLSNDKDSKPSENIIFNGPYLLFRYKTGPRNACQQIYNIMYNKNIQTLHEKKLSTKRNLNLKKGIKYAMELGHGKARALMLEIKNKGKECEEYKYIKDYANKLYQQKKIDLSIYNLIIGCSKAIIKILQNEENLYKFDIDAELKIDLEAYKCFYLENEENNDDEDKKLRTPLWYTLQKIDKTTWCQYKDKISTFVEKTNENDSNHEIVEEMAAFHVGSLSIEPPTAVN